MFTIFEGAAFVRIFIYLYIYSKFLILKFRYKLRAPVLSIKPAAFIGKVGHYWVVSLCTFLLHVNSYSCNIENALE